LQVRKTALYVLFKFGRMLGRRQYRIKILQALYAFFQGGEPRIEIAEKNLFNSIDKTYELFYLQFSFLLEFIDFFRQKTEDAKHKFFPTEEEKNPNLRLLENKVVLLLQENNDLLRQIDKYKFNWSEEQDMLRKIYQKAKDSKDYRDYLESSEDSFVFDRDFIALLYKKFIARSPELIFYCEERNIYWVDDYDWAATFVLKVLKTIPENFKAKDTVLAVLAKDSEEDPADDRRFISNLFRKTIIHSEEFATLISERTRNWEVDRIALTDFILLKMALAELLHFPNIPVKVTLNEYIEISKYFSSVKSKLFINGILDKLVSDLREEDKIHKTGRGLLEK